MSSNPLISHSLWIQVIFLKLNESVTILFLDLDVYKRQVDSNRSFTHTNRNQINLTVISVSYTHLDVYKRQVSAIETYIEQGDLIAEKEFYSAVRFRGQKVNRSFLDKGIAYLEFRNFDLNPFERIGISQTTMDTVHLLILAFLWLDKMCIRDSFYTKNFFKLFS